MDLPPLIRAMTRSSFYPHRPEKVELIQTHISYVFLAGQLVYKVKKPVDFGFLNFTTLRRRGYYCRKELNLNRRLAPELYLAVVPIRREKGNFKLAGRGKVVDYALIMRRIPKNSFLPNLLEKGQTTSSMMGELAGLIADFHKQSPAGPSISRFGSIQILRKNSEENFSQTLKYIGRTITEKDYELISDYTRSFQSLEKSLLERRVSSGRIKDGHGDLHAEHIGWKDGKPFVFDCIEFNTRFRYADVAAEVAFLVMDLEYRGAWPLARVFLDHYLKASGDWEILPLLDFYLCYRAFVRGKINSFMVDDPHNSADTRKQALRRAKRYFGLAAAYAERDSRPLMVVVTGLVGTGKSTVADILAEKMSFKVIRSDEVRKKLADIQLMKKVHVNYGKGLYSDEMTERTYAAMLGECESLVGSGSHVILDATFSTQKVRLNAKRLAESSGARFRLIETVCNEDLVKKRLAGRMKKGDSPSDGRWEIYVRQRGDYQEPSRFSKDEYHTVDTDGDKKQIYSALLRGLYPLLPTE